jgi:sugar phosphate isomerase/epimerase
MNRREFLGSSLTAGAVLAAGTHSLGAAQATTAQQSTPATASLKKLPIGVFNPPFRKLSLDEMLDLYVSMGIEAAEIGAPGYTGTPQCPAPDLIADPAKAKAWKKKFDDRGIPIMTLTCHANPLYPDTVKGPKFAQQFKDAIQLAGMLEIPTVCGFSGCPASSATEITPAWVVYNWPPEHAATLKWQWEERVIPYWKDIAQFASDHGVKRIALEMHPNMVVYNARTLMRLRDAVGDVIGANCDLSHMFWQGCDAVELIRYLGKQGAMYHAHMKDTAFFPQNVDRFGVLNFGLTTDKEASECFRTVGYGHGASEWKDVMAAYMEIGYDGMISIENEDALLSGEEGVRRGLTLLKNVREELLAGHTNPGEHVSA